MTQQYIKLNTGAKEIQKPWQQPKHLAPTISSIDTCVVSENDLRSFCGYSVAVKVDLEDYFSQEWSQTLSGPHEHQNSMLVDL